MAYSNNIITDPVSISDVQAAVSHTSGDLGTLITEGEINKWARYKPISLAYIQRLSYSQIANAKFGLVPAVNTQLAKKSDTSESGSSIVANTTELENVLNANADWTYIKPSGGSSSPYRLTDFYAPSDKDSGWGYYPLTPQPMSNVGDWGMKLKDIINCANDTTITHVSGGSTNTNWKVTDNVGYPIYSFLTFRFGEGTYDNVNGADVRAIALNELLGVASSNQYWRLVVAVQVPSSGTLTFMRMFSSRYSFIEAQATSGSGVPRLILPAISTNQFLCWQIKEYADYLYNLNGTDVLGNKKLTVSNPTFSLPACLCLVKDMYLDTVARSSGSGTWEKCRLSNASSVYSVPSSISRISLIITDDYHWSDSQTEAYSLVTISAEPTGQYAQMGEETWKRQPIVNLVLRQNTSSTKTVYYRVTYTYVTGYNGSVPTITTGTVSGSVALSNSASSFVVQSLAGGPGLTVGEKKQSTSPL